MSDNLKDKLFLINYDFNLNMEGGGTIVWTTWFRKELNVLRIVFEIDPYS